MSAIWSKQVDIPSGLKKTNDEITSYLQDQGVIS